MELKDDMLKVNIERGLLQDDTFTSVVQRLKDMKWTSNPRLGRYYTMKAMMMYYRMHAVCRGLKSVGVGQKALGVCYVDGRPRRRLLGKDLFRRSTRRPSTYRNAIGCPRHSDRRHSPP